MRSCAAIAALPGGSSFKLHEKSAGHLSEGCQFLGHHLRLADHGLRVLVSGANAAKLMKKMEALLDGCGVFTCGAIGAPECDTAKITQALADMLGYLQSWKAAFAACDDVDLHVLPHWNDIKMALVKIKATPEELARVYRRLTCDPKDHWYGLTIVDAD